VLSVQGLTKSFDGFLAVKNVSFEVAEGEILGLIGPNGSGKSTTFNLIAGAFQPTSGSVRFKGEEIAGLPAYRVAHAGIGRTHQIPKPFRKLSILDNVALAAFYGRNQTQGRQKAYEVARECLDLVGLRGERVDGLGAAGLKKLELAKALATGPKLLLADESLGGLDEHEMDQAADMLRKIRDELGITIIWVEHIMGVLMRVVDRVMVLDHGEKISEGLPSAVAGDPRVIEVYLGTDADSSQAAAAEARRKAGV
jgi:branched-chain amino acid transport system ATP-binding protein